MSPNISLFSPTPGITISNFVLILLIFCLDYFYRADMTKYHKTHGLNSRHFLSHTSRLYNLEIKASAGLVPSMGCEGKSVPYLASFSLLIISGHP